MAFVWFPCTLGFADWKKTTVWQRQEPESDVVSVALEAVVATNNEFRFAIGKCSWIWNGGRVMQSQQFHREILSLFEAKHLLIYMHIHIIQWLRLSIGIYIENTAYTMKLYVCHICRSAREKKRWILTHWGGCPHLPLVDCSICGLIHTPQLLSAILGKLRSGVIKYQPVSAQPRRGI